MNSPLFVIVYFAIPLAVVVRDIIMLLCGKFSEKGYMEKTAVTFICCSRL
jgi:hypothetical protein